MKYAVEARVFGPNKIVPKLRKAFDGEEMYVPHNNVTNKYEEMSVQNFIDYIMDYVKSNPNDAATCSGLNTIQ